MKKILLSALLCSSAFIHAQKIQLQTLTSKTTSTVDMSPLFPSEANKQKPTSIEKSICTDKVRYGDKGTAQAGGDVGETNWGAVQVFPGFTGTVTGATFNGNSLSGVLNASDSFALVVYDIYYEAVFDAYCPTGSPLGGKYFTSIGTSVTDNSLTFTTPVTITNPDGFAVALTCYGDGDSVNVNMSPDNTGDGGHFSFMLGGGTIYSLYLSGYDTDFMIYPDISFNQPTIGLSANTNTICEGSSVVFSNTPSVTLPVWYDVVYGMASFNPIPMYNSSIQNTQLWSYDYGDGSALSYSNSQSGSTHSYANVGSYTAELALNYQGYTTNCQSTSTEAIVVNGPPTGGFTWASTGLTVEFNQTTTGATTYSWNFGDAGNSSAPNPFHTYAASGTYTVELTATNSCGSELIYANIVITDSTNSGNLGINETGFAQFSLYPNPSNGKFNIEVDEDGMQMVIVDLVGKLVQEKELVKGKNIADLSNEAKGVYLVSFKDESGNIRSERVVIE